MPESPEVLLRRLHIDGELERLIEEREQLTAAGCERERNEKRGQQRQRDGSKHDAKHVGPPRDTRGRYRMIARAAAHGVGVPHSFALMAASCSLFRVSGLLRIFLMRACNASMRSLGSG